MCMLRCGSSCEIWMTLIYYVKQMPQSVFGVQVCFHLPVFLSIILHKRNLSWKKKTTQIFKSSSLGWGGKDKKRKNKLCNSVRERDFSNKWWCCRTCLCFTDDWFLDCCRCSISIAADHCFMPVTPKSPQNKTWCKKKKKRNAWCVDGGNI